MSVPAAPELVLASVSPRRAELLAEAGLAFRVDAPEVEELHDESLTCEELTVENARLKALAVATRSPQAVVLAAVLGGEAAIIFAGSWWP